MNDTEVEEPVSQREVEVEVDDQIDNEISNLERSVEEADNGFEPVEIAETPPQDDKNNITIGSTDHDETEEMLTAQNDVKATSNSEMMKLLLPEGEQVKDTLVHLDMVIKFQTILYEFHSIMFWMSLAEIVLLAILLIFFLRSPS